MRPASPITVLLLGAGSDLQCAREFEQIRDALRETKFGQDFVVEHHYNVYAERLIELVQRYEPTVLHFSGHTDTTGDLMFSAPNGAVRLVDPRVFSAALGQLSHIVSCVVLNACTSAEFGELIARKVEVVVAQREQISDDAAVGFAAEFYRALGKGQSYERAWELGRDEVALMGLPESRSARLIAVRDPAALSRPLVDVEGARRPELRERDTTHSASTQRAPRRGFSTLVGLGCIAAAGLMWEYGDEPEAALTELSAGVSEWANIIERATENDPPVRVPLTDKAACAHDDVTACAALGARYVEEEDARKANFYLGRACKLGDEFACETLVPSAQQVCTHELGLLSRGGGPIAAPSGGAMHDSCVNQLVDHARSQDRRVYERHASCVLASRSAGELRRCAPL